MSNMHRHLSSTSRVRRMLSNVPAIVASIISLAAWSRPAAQTQPAASDSCETLALLLLPNTTITAAQTVSAGAFTPPGRRGGPAAAPWTDLPAFCRVAATTKMLNSDVDFEVWLPARGWNGDFRWSAAASSVGKT